MATRKTTSTKPAKLPASAAGGELDPAQLKREMAVQLFEDIATLANTLDRECYWAHGDQVEDREAERVQQELDRLRDAVCRIGWMADLGHQHLTGHTEVRGDAEAWLLSPVYREHRKAVAAAAEVAHV